MKLKLRERLLLPVLFLIILGMGISIVISSKNAKDSIYQITKQNMVQTVDNVVQSLNAWLMQHQSVIKTMAEVTTFANAVDDTQTSKELIETANKRLEHFNSQHNEFEAIFITGKNGRIKASSVGSSTSNIDISDRPYFKEAIQGKTVFSDVITSRQSGNIIFTITAPLVKNSKVIGVLAGTVRIEGFTDHIKDIKVGETGYIFMCKDDGTAIYHPDKSLVLKASLSGYDWGKKMITQKQGYMEYNWGKTPTISVYKNSEITGWLVISRVSPEELFASANELQKLNIIIALITVSALCIAIILLTKFIILKPVDLALSFAKEIASGNLKASVKLDRNDELGDLVFALNGMGEKLRDMFQIDSLRELVEKLSRDSAKLNDISEKMNTDIKTASEKSEEVSVKSIKMTENIKIVSKELEESSENMSSVAAGAEQMTSTIDEIAENTEKTGSITKDAVEKTMSASERINLLGEAAKAIGAVTVTIKDISEQTNLLALNATIEAARAGEAGKGFAVVAGEIKELASQTAKATADIAEKIKNIQESTDITVSDINEIGSTIKDIDSFVTSISAAIEEQSVTTREIAESVNQTSIKIASVSEKVMDNSGAASQITDEITEVTDINIKLEQGSLVVRTSSQELEELAQKVRGLVSQFKI
ncbi:MAG: methyl-accepting chemotaxis protein [Desulfobacteraceae bacterium]|nr:methyl-accepting chemotaxis protein [Desulfobacteraceae bacterium]MCB9494990.1 methyl-accepting chemotaxis protein [Desulfobacteraceae bacterium]